MKTLTQELQELEVMTLNQKRQNLVRKRRKIKNAMVILGMPVGYILGMLGGKVINAFFTGFWKWAIGLTFVAVLIFILLKLMARFWNPEDLEGKASK